MAGEVIADTVAVGIQVDMAVTADMADRDAGTVRVARPTGAARAGEGTGDGRQGTELARGVV
jgi:hypothetical protein